MILCNYGAQIYKQTSGDTDKAIHLFFFLSSSAAETFISQEARQFSGAQCNQLARGAGLLQRTRFRMTCCSESRLKFAPRSTDHSACSALTSPTSGDHVEGQDHARLAKEGAAAFTQPSPANHLSSKDSVFSPCEYLFPPHCCFPLSETDMRSSRRGQG